MTKNARGPAWLLVQILLGFCLLGTCSGCTPLWLPFPVLAEKFTAGENIQLTPSMGMRVPEGWSGEGLRRLVASSDATWDLDAHQTRDISLYDGTVAGAADRLELLQYESVAAARAKVDSAVTRMKLGLLPSNASPSLVAAGWVVYGRPAIAVSDGMAATSTAVHRPSAMVLYNGGGDSEAAVVIFAFGGSDSKLLRLLDRALVARR